MSTRTQTLATRTGAVLAAAAVAQFLVAFDMSVMNIALPAIQRSLHFADADLSWVVNAYALAFGGLLLLGGRLCDVVGTRRVLVIGFAVFGIVSVLGAFATSAWMLVAARAIQGVGAALIAPAGLTALGRTFPDGAARAKAFGIGAMASAGGGAIGVVLSGILTDAGSWRLVMFSAAPFAAVAIVAALRGLPVHDSTERDPLDAVGALLVTVGLTALVYAIVSSESHSWTSSLVLGSLVVAALFLAAFVVVETRTRYPLVRFSTLLRPRIGLSNLVMCILCAAQFSGFYFVSLYVQRILGYSPTRAGLAFLPFCVGLVIAIVTSTKLLPKIGARPLLGVGTALATLGALSFSFMHVGGTFVGTLLLPSILLSIGVGLSFMPLSNIATFGVPADEVGMASGLLSTSRQIGGSLGMAALVTVASSSTARSTETWEVALAGGYSLALLVCAGLLAVGFVLSLMIRDR